MPVFAWLFGLITLFVLVIIFYIFVPMLHHDIYGTLINSSINTSSEGPVRDFAGIARSAVPIALLVLIIGVILYMVAATQVEEPHTDII